MTYEQVAALALAMPDVTEKHGRSEADLFRNGRHMARLRERGRAVAFRLPWEWCDHFLESRPEVFFKTPHYDGYPYVLAWLGSLDAVLAKQLLELSWEAAPEALPTFKTPRL